MPQSLLECDIIICGVTKLSIYETRDDLLL